MRGWGVKSGLCLRKTKVVEAEVVSSVRQRQVFAKQVKI